MHSTTELFEYTTDPVRLAQLEVDRLYPPDQDAQDSTSVKSEFDRARHQQALRGDVTLNFNYYQIRRRKRVTPDRTYMSIDIVNVEGKGRYAGGYYRQWGSYQQAKRWVARQNAMMKAGQLLFLQTRGKNHEAMGR